MHQCHHRFHHRHRSGQDIGVMPSFRCQLFEMFSSGRGVKLSEEECNCHYAVQPLAGETLALSD
ncbi:hypothetical protein [Nostoc sp.]|uniref:hypothetical protein n=1 Tax=Nostoc sp. TaxID=1180 RepID=UPI002FFA62CA